MHIKQGSELPRAPCREIPNQANPREGVKAMELEKLVAVLSATAALIRVALKLWEAIASRRKEKRAKHKDSTR